MPHVGRIPSTLEKYRHALSAYLEDVTQLNMKSSNSYSFIYGDEKTDHIDKPNGKDKATNKSLTPIPDTETRINSSYNTVKKQLDLLSSYFSLIHDDLHGDLLLLRTNLNLLPSNTLHIAQQNNAHSTPSLHIISDVDDDDDIDETTHSLSDTKTNEEHDDAEDQSQLCSVSNSQCSSPHPSSTPSHLHADDAILNTKQTQSIQCIVSILQKFIKHNAILVEYIQQNKSKIDSFWIENTFSHHGQIHKLNLDVESIVSTMCVKDLIHTKSYSCHNILFHDILGCANTKQFFTRIYFIVSIWYSFFHSLHLDKYHDDDEDPISSQSLPHIHPNDDEDDQEYESTRVKACDSYLTKQFAMTDFSFLTKTASSPSACSSSSRSLSLESNQTATNRANNTSNTHSLPVATSPQSSADSNWSSSCSTHHDEDDAEDASCSRHHDEEMSLTADSSTSSKNDFLLKYLNAQNNYLQSIWHDGIALLEYSLHLLQQQEFRLSCRVAHRCLELFQKQQLEQERLRHQQQQQQNWDNLNRDLYGDNTMENEDTNAPHSPNGTQHNVGLFMVDPVTNQPAQIPGLWYIEMHLANCYHTWGQSNMALYHINRTLDHLGNYQINPDTLTVRLNTRRKFRLLSSYLVQQTEQKVKKKQREKELKHDLYIKESKSTAVGGEYGSSGRRRNNFMRKIKINNRRRRKSNVFSKLFDRFSGSKKKRRERKERKNKENNNNENDSANGSPSQQSVRSNASQLSLIEDENELCLEEDLDLKMEEDTDQEMDDENDSDLEELFFHNDTDTGDEDDAKYNGNSSQMITLEALLSMHMTKGRILIEMKLLREALDLYTYIINECEALIKYHWLINPHHIQLEVEYDDYSEQKEDASNASCSPRRRRRRRRSSRADNDVSAHQVNDDNDLLHANHNQPPPNTPYRRLAKNIGLENYYAARGDIFFKFKDLKNALKDFSNAIKYGKCKKEMGIYYNLRGVCYHEMKQYERALKDYDNAVKSMYGNHVAWNNRAALLVDMRQYDDAIENANNAIKLDPSYGNAYKHRGVAYHLKCEFEKAITDINRCIKLLPNYRPARLALLAIWKDIFACVRVVNVEEGVPLDLVKIVVDYTVGNGYEIDEYMVNFTYC
eukprot:117398_1